jgi:16S rRNA (cytosine967-C5)-methyltransferase
MSSAQLLQHLKLHGIEAKSYPAITLDSGRSLETPAAIVLLKPLPVHQIPGFDEGWWSVQDAAAQLAAPLLLQGLKSAAADTPKSHRWRVLDACAAPGGKTAHLLEMANLDLWVLDADEQRLAKVEQNLKRLKLGEASGSQVSMRAVDARQVRQWWDGEPFDAILLDAPCSASGIVRRHPDARWLRRPSDIPALAQIQSELLDQLWPLLRPGGQMLYATCSVFKQEGQNQIDAFMQRIGLQNAQLNPTSPQHILPMVNNALADSEQTIICDGFYYGLLHKF